MRRSAASSGFAIGFVRDSIVYQPYAGALRGVDGTVVKRWNVDDAFPVKWEGPSLNVEGNQVAVETLEIAHHGLKLSE